MSHFYSDSVKILDRVNMYRTEIADLEFRAAPCELLKAQLEEALVLSERFQTNIRKLLKVSEMKGIE